MRWAGAAIDPSDPVLPEGAQPLSGFVRAPAELARRLAQIGVVERGDGPRLAALLKPGQRLVTREGDSWRWDGFAAAAHAPTGAARRLAERGRLAAIETELTTARTDMENNVRALEAAEAARAAAAAAEIKARARWREAQQLADAAREEHAAAEREISRNAARVSALQEARQRTCAGRDEAVAARAEAENALNALPPAAELETRLTQVNEDVARIARRSPRCASKHRRSRATPSSPAVAYRRSSANAPNGASARTRPQHRSRPSVSAPNKQRPSAPSSTRRRRNSPPSGKR